MNFPELTIEQLLTLRASEIKGMIKHSDDLFILIKVLQKHLETAYKALMMVHKATGLFVTVRNKLLLQRAGSGQKYFDMKNEELLEINENEARKLLNDESGHEMIIGLLKILQQRLKQSEAMRRTAFKGFVS